MAEILCRHFSGYKPCGRNDSCTHECPSRSLVETRVLIVHLGALGAVVRSTALLKAIQAKYRNAQITWVTEKPAHHLLKGHPAIDRVLTTDPNDLLALSCLEFDVAFCIDKSLSACGVLKRTKFKSLYGFRAESSTGAIVPATHAAQPLWEIGLSNKKKFFENKKPEIQLVTEALELSYCRDSYWLPLNPQEIDQMSIRREEWLRIAPKVPVVVGLNTGCSGVIPYKKLSVETHRQLVSELQEVGVSVVLLGGPEDTDRNSKIAAGLPVISSATDKGLRDGLISVAACDIVVTGDSLGMHMAISQNKWTVAWFGPTCAHEIDLFDRGTHVLTKAPCSPCWKRSCDMTTMCYDQVELSEIIDGVKKGIQWLASSLTPQVSQHHSSSSSRLNSHPVQSL